MSSPEDAGEQIERLGGSWRDEQAPSVDEPLVDGLTAGQLIEALKEYPPDLPVVITWDGRLYWQKLQRGMVYQSSTEGEDADRMGSTSIWMFDGENLPDALKIGG